MSSPGVLDLNVRYGDSFDLSLDVTRTGDGTVVDWTQGYVFLAQIARGKKVADVPLAEFTVTAVAPGVIRVFLPVSESRKLAPLLGLDESGEGVWDLQVGPASNPEVSTTILEGKVTVKGDVSREEPA